VVVEYLNICDSSILGMPARHKLRYEFASVSDGFTVNTSTRFTSHFAYSPFLPVVSWQNNDAILSALLSVYLLLCVLLGFFCYCFSKSSDCSP